MFGLELPEPYLVTGMQPTGLLKMFVGKSQECQAGKSAWHGNCGVVKGGSDLTCKTNSTLPSFVKCRREVFQANFSHRLSSLGFFLFFSPNEPATLSLAAISFDEL